MTKHSIRSIKEQDMRIGMNNMKAYWDKRFSSEGMIWGQEPSKTVYHAREVFMKHNSKTILVPGSGYGRNTKVLSSDFQVDGIELSQDAIKLAMDWDPDTHFIEGSVLDKAVSEKKYDAIYCFDVLHLFLLHDRQKFIRNCVLQLNNSGVMYFTCFSDEDPNNGIGRLVEEGTFEYTEGKYAHFFSEKDLIDHFEGMQIIETGTVNEKLTYLDNRTKEYILRYIIAKKG